MKKKFSNGNHQKKTGTSKLIFIMKNNSCIRWLFEIEYVKPHTQHRPFYNIYRSHFFEGIQHYIAVRPSVSQIDLDSMTRLHLININ